MNTNEIKLVIQEMSQLLNFNFNNVDVKEGSENSISATKERVEIFAKDKCYIARALSVVKREFSKENYNFNIKENSSFEECGIMLDMSRNGVMRVEAVKKYISYLAAFGLNTLWLYTEDTYELKEYPFFGYMRGRYTQNELKQIDDYAFLLGIEVVPCIQTLGHMEQYLRHGESAPLRDTPSVMLCGSEATYNFIDAAIKFFSKTLRTRKIHIGMDEANDIGTGAYLAKNGYKNRQDIILDHLERVCEICKKYGMHPMMWHDMYIRMGSKRDYHYDLDAEISKEITDKIPDVDMVQWDYYHDSEEFYDKYIQIQKQMNKKILFASGIWTWDGLLPNVSYTIKTMVPAMKSAKRADIQSFIGTMWSDGGCETNHFYALFALAILSEHNYKSCNASDAEIEEMLKIVANVDMKAIGDIDSFNQRYEGLVQVMDGQTLAIRKGSQLVWNDILYDLIDYDTSKMVFAYENLEKCVAKNDEWKDFYDFAQTVIKIAEIKRDISKNLRAKYAKGDKEYIKNLADMLPDLKAMYQKAYKLHQKLWKQTYKVFGWETISIRYLTAIGRIDYAKDELTKYANGKIDEIEEMSQQKLFQKLPQGKYFKHLASTSNLF